MKGQIISGTFGEILVRKKSDVDLELGELLITEDKNSKTLLQVKDLIYGSQISQQNLELLSGMDLEEGAETYIYDKNLRLYTLAKVKSLLKIKKEKLIDGMGEQSQIPKDLPEFFSSVKEVQKSDLNFLQKPKNPLKLGKLRSGSKILDMDIFIDGKKALSHHILIPATTGRGKSNLLSCILFDSVDKDYCGTLILDPHDEYFGRTGIGLKDHKDKERVIYYTSKDVPVGQRSLIINIEKLRPSHFNGVTSWSPAQNEAINAYYKKYKYKWIEAIVIEKPVDGFAEGTLGVLKRRMLNLLDLSFEENKMQFNGIFKLNAGQNTISDICNELENANAVIIDTSNFSGPVEILIGSMITNEIFNKYKYYKSKGKINNKPVISIVLEEAPRVLGKEVLEKGTNIFSTIAREGRKFQIGLLAVTQLPSLIPRQILANMNTKIILGIEMNAERQAIIDSAAQDLSGDSKAIAALDVGEGLISSNFLKFAIPIKAEYYNDVIKTHRLQQKENSTIRNSTVSKTIMGLKK